MGEGREGCKGECGSGGRTRQWSGEGGGEGGGEVGRIQQRVTGQVAAEHVRNAGAPEEQPHEASSGPAQVLSQVQRPRDPGMHAYGGTTRGCICMCTYIYTYVSRNIYCSADEEKQIIFND